MARGKKVMEKIGALVPQQGDCSTQVSVLGRAPEELCLQRVRILSACYRKGEAEDPEIYAAACGAVLSDYPLQVVLRVTDPRTGLPSVSQWLPTVKEIRDACEVIVQAEARREKRDRDLKVQMADRVRFEAEQAAKFDRQLLGIEPKWREPLEPEKFKRKYGISDLEFNALPDAPVPKAEGRRTVRSESILRRM